jgi:thiosulfate/3-mercaptopyruvate sulfurtransferase
MTAPLVTSAWLREHLGDPDVRIVDCRYRLGEPGAGRVLWREGHIPRAAFLDLDRDLAARPGERGRHPLPDADAFGAAARRAGIGQATLVVAYDEAAEGGAARLWWLLRHFGHANVTVLDGGLRGWREEGGELRAGEEMIEPGDFRAAPPSSAPASAEELRVSGESPRAADLASQGARAPVLLDARAPERYRGEIEPIDPVAGRIPGALNMPFASLPEAASSRRRSSGLASRRPEWRPATRPLRTAARASRRASSCWRRRLPESAPRGFTRARGASGPAAASRWSAAEGRTR